MGDHPVNDGSLFKVSSHGLMPALKRFCSLAEFSQLANFLNMAKKK
jgi:hypothetical protein